MPLQGQRILITRAFAGTESLTERLSALGAVPIVAPTIQVGPPDDWGPVDAAIARLHEFDWLVLTSVNGVQQLAGRLRALGAALPKALKLAVVGPKTAEAARVAGWAPDLVPETTHGEGLAAALAPEAAGKRFLLARGNMALSELPDGLERAGGLVTSVVTYTNQPGPGEAAAAEAIAQGDIDWALFASGSAFRQLVKALPDAEMLRGVKLASIGPKTSAVIRQLGFEVAAEAPAMTLEGLLEAVQGG